MPHLNVEMTLLPESHGGRHSAVSTGYRPQLYFFGSDWDASHEYGAIEHLAPGQAAIAELTFPNPKNHVARLFVGMPFLLREGNRTIGYGRVLDILDPELSRPHDYKNEFYFQENAVGVLATELPPLADGEYGYEPYRGAGHYCMQTMLASGSTAACHSMDGNVKVNFDVMACPRYGVIQLANIQRDGECRRTNR